MSLKFRKNLSGQQFGRLVALSFAPRANSSQSFWLCRCDCGAECEVSQCHLASGHTTSCGCAYLDSRGKAQKTHGLSKSREYAVWMGMIARCTYPSATGFAHYGGRGITVCDRWRESFEAFLADMGPRPSPKHQIDRINNDGPYEPGNCRWATKKEQMRNTSRNRLITYDGRTYSLPKWAELAGLPSKVLADRLRLRWSFHRAITTPLRRLATPADSGAQTRCPDQTL